MDNAKAMAADLDTKLNESVGIDSSGKPIDTNTTTSNTPSFSKTIPSASFETPLATPPTGGNATKITEDGDDAWNDDFDFDDDGNTGDTKPVENVTAPDPIQAVATVPQTITPPKTEKVEPVNLLATSVAKSSQKESVAPITPKATTPTAPKMVDSEKLTESDTKTIPKPTIQSAVETQVVPPKQSLEPPSKPSTASETLPGSKDAPKDTAIIPSSSSEKDGEDGLDTELDDKGDATEEKTSPVPSVPAAVTPTTEPTSSAKEPVSGGGGLFSNFSKLTKTADSLLSPIVKASGSEKEDEDVAAIAVKKDEKDASEYVDQTPDYKAEEPSIPKSTPVPPPIATPKAKTATSIPKFTPGGSLFSKMTNLAQTADSLLTAAVEQSGDVGKRKIVESSDPVDSGGWDEDVDDDFFDDEEKEDENIAEQKIENPTSIATNIPSAALESEEKRKTEESTASSFVEVSPTSSISTPEITTKTTPIPQQPKEESGKDLPGQASSSPPEIKAVEAPPSKASTTPMVATTNIEDDPRFQRLQETLRLREEQLIDKGTQLNELQLLLESRDEQYKKKLSDTKEEAKKRILRAKEHCELVEAKLSSRSSGDSGDLKKKQSIIDELMEEGQALAKKQSVMERAVRDATTETRTIAAELQQESSAKEKALQKIKELEATCKSLKDDLASARKGESQAGKLEDDLLSAKADAEEKASTILSLQQRMKELVANLKELQHEIDDTRKSAAHESQQEKTSMRREHNDMIGDLQQKLRTTEREAGVREDALRHEISEIRKRWQDSVRRADALSMDIQSSTAPLLRQLESMERQSRLRTANSAELESRLRSDLEDAVVENERLGKESSEFRSKLSRLERSIKDRDRELSKAQSTLTEQESDLENLRNQEKKLTAEAEARQAEYEKVERLANEGVARVRSEMSKTVTDSEERYRGQIDKLQKELVVEKEKRNQLETQVGQLLEGGGGLFAAAQASQPMRQAPNALGIKRESKPKKLHKAENQAEILAGALGLGDDSSDDGFDSDSDDDGELFDGEGKGSENQASSGGYHSFAAIEQLSSKLKTSEVELKSMRKSLKESNELHQSLVEELGVTRAAKEKLPLFEEKVKQLTQENREMELEIAGLKDDIVDVRDLYRTQLNVLLEEKTASIAANANQTEGSPASENQTQGDANENEKASGDDDW